MLFTEDRLHKTLIQKVKKYFSIFIPVVRIYQKGFSQEESDSSNLLLSLMKQIEDVIILKFIFLEKNLLPDNKACTILFSCKNLRVNWIKVIKNNISLIRKFLAAYKKVIGLFCFKGTRAQWVQCILKIISKFMFSELAQTNTKTFQ